MEEDNHSDHSAAEEEEEEHAPPALTTSSPSPEQEPSISIRRSKYTSDVDDNDTPKTDDSSVSYTGSITHGIFHAIDSTTSSKQQQPGLHVWLGDIQLWPFAVNHYLKSTKKYDSFMFTPFSSQENWNKTNPELATVASIMPNGSRSKKKTKSATNNKQQLSAKAKKKSHLMRNNDKDFIDIMDEYIFSGSVFSIIVKISLFVCFVYITSLLASFIGYAIASWKFVEPRMECVDTAVFGGNQQYCTAVEVGGLERIGLLLGKFMDDHLSGLAIVGGQMYSAVVSGQGQEASTECNAKENSNDLLNLDDDDDDQEEEADRNIAYDGSDLIDWIKSNGGFIHPNARIGLDPTGQYRGVFVKSVGGEEGGTTDGIEEDELVCSIPWELIVKPNNYRYNDYGPSCDAMHFMYHQFQLGEESKYAPYINYLKDQPAGRIPSEWSEDGKELLATILDQDGKAGLPPFDALDRFEQEWMGQCKGEDTPLARSAFFQFTSRDEDNLMVPFFDMHNHSNDPKKLNTVPYKPEEQGEKFTMYAARDIAPGEQIIISYNRCHGCWFDKKYKDCDTTSYQGTDHLFSQFGFVEDYPQFWKIPQYHDDGRLFDTITFCLDTDDEGEVFLRRFGENGSDEQDEVPVVENLVWMEEHLHRLHKLKRSLKNDNALKESMTNYEWETAWTYHEAMFNAIATAFEAVTEEAPFVDSEDNSPDDDFEEDDSEDDDIKMAFIEDVVEPIEEDLRDVIEDGSWDDSVDVEDEDPDSCMGDLDDDSQDYSEDFSSDDDEVMEEEVKRKKAVLKGT